MAPAETLPVVTLAVAEKVLRDIARRNGETIKKRRSQTLKDNYGNGYAVIEPNRNLLLSGGQTSDGCDLSLPDLAKRYEADENNTTWQKIVIKSIRKDRVSE